MNGNEFLSTYKELCDKHHTLIATGKPTRDMTGYRSGKLVAIEYAGKKEGTRKMFWKCKCDCGNIIIVQQGNLHKNTTKSCGCISKVQMIGFTFGILTVIESAGKNERGFPLWLCKCECGKDKISTQSSLRQGTVRSCGCLVKNRKRIYSKEESTWRSLWSSLVHRAKKRSVKLTIEYSEWKEQLTSYPDCYYCGREPQSRDLLHLTSGAPITTHGIDRIDSSKGYVAGNIRTCCRQCNTGKMDYSEDEFISMCKMVSAKHSEAS